MQTPNCYTHWHSFIDTLCRALAGALTAIIFMQLLRLITLQQFQEEVVTQDLGSYLFYSLRWDVKLAATGIAITLLIFSPLLLLNSPTYIRLAGKLMTTFLLLFFCSTSFIHTIYWKNVGQPFDIFIFGIADDQTTELLKLFITQYNPIGNGILLLLIVTIAIFIQERLYLKLRIAGPIQYLATSNTATLKIVLVISTLALLALAARGSFSLFPLNKKNTHFSSSNFLNNLAINATNHLYYAFKEKSKNAVKKNTSEVLKAHGYKSIEDAKNDLLLTYDQTKQGVPLLKTSAAPKFEKLPNVVFVMMESWSTQLLLADSEQQNLLGSFRTQKDQGALFTHFLGTRLGTNRFIESTLLNTSVLELSTSSAKNHRLAYSNLQPFISKGYQIAFVSGGARSWLNHDSFWKSQGVDYYWDMSDIMKAYHIDKHSDWGVHDEYTYRFALAKLNELSTAEKPVFMFIITTSNHPPHAVPENYDAPEVSPTEFSEHLIQPENAPLQLATFSYASDQLGLFLQSLDQSLHHNHTIRLATGDHVLRNFYQFSSKRDKLLAGAVPFFIQVPAPYMNGKKWDTSVVGSQRDIFPTLFELILADSQYLKTGFNLLEPTEPKAAWFEKNIWLRGNLVTFGDEDTTYSYNNALQVTDQVAPEADLLKYKKHINAMEALLEWQLVAELSATDKEAAQ